MNLIDNGVGKFTSYEKVDDGENLGFKVVFVDYYGKTLTKYVTSISEVKAYQESKINWME